MVKGHDTHQTWHRRERSYDADLLLHRCLLRENIVSTTLIGRSGTEGGRDWQHGNCLIRDLAEWVDGPYFEHARPDHPEDLQRHLGLERRPSLPEAPHSCGAGK
jgi:hypothetical protein